MVYSFVPRGVCSRKMEIEMENGTVREVRITSGCDGNLKGISKLVIGRRAEEVIELLQGIQCGHRQTSCPDQLAEGLKLALEAEKQGAETA